MEKIKIQISPEQADSFDNMLKQIGQNFDRVPLEDGRVQFEFEANPMLQGAIAQVQADQAAAAPKIELEASKPDEAPKKIDYPGNSQPQARG